VTDVFDGGVALHALRLLQLAHDRWLSLAADLQGKRFVEVGDRDEAAALLHGYAVEVLLWARAVDDWCLGLPRYGKPTAPVLATYEQARPALEDLLEGARYAVNHSIHQLTGLTRPYGVMRFPLNTRDIFDTFAGIRWLPEGHLPQLSEPDPTQQRFRQKYVAHMAGREMGPTLLQLRSWFEAQV
jgi:hypothetical protein